MAVIASGFVSSIRRETQPVYPTEGVEKLACSEFVAFTASQFHSFTVGGMGSDSVLTGQIPEILNRAYSQTARPRVSEVFITYIVRQTVIIIGKLYFIFESAHACA
jgi:hypothetical protein